MQILVIVAYISTLVWLIPPFKQYKTKYFAFFLVIAISEVAVIILWKIFQIKPQIISSIASLFLIYSFFNTNYKKTIITAGLAVVLLFVEQMLSDRQLLVVISLSHIIICVIIINDFLKYILKKNAISLFFIFLITYEISIILKNIIFLTDIKQNIILFSTTTFFQIFFGIVFSFININSKVFPISKKVIS